MSSIATCITTCTCITFVDIIFSISSQLRVNLLFTYNIKKGYNLLFVNSDCCLTPTKNHFLLYHGENRLHEMMIYD